ncbi:hypothetical protein H4582DRAFT_2064957 [Lactarius indigo]|nr:hypothetical protein H4582DRAFT_2064957 [Lactarius indigo]
MPTYQQGKDLTIQGYSCARLSDVQCTQAGPPTWYPVRQQDPRHFSVGSLCDDNATPTSVAEVRSGTSVRTRMPKPNGNVPFLFRFWFSASVSGLVPRSGVTGTCTQAISPVTVIPITTLPNGGDKVWGSPRAMMTAGMTISDRFKGNTQLFSPRCVLFLSFPFAPSHEWERHSTTIGTILSCAFPLSGPVKGFVQPRQPSYNVTPPNIQPLTPTPGTNMLVRIWSSEGIDSMEEQSHSLLDQSYDVLHNMVAAEFGRATMSEDDGRDVAFSSVPESLCTFTNLRHNLGEDVSHHNKFLSIPWYRIFRLMMADNDEQCALMPDGTLKEPDKIIWYNDPDDAKPISAPGLGALSHIDSDASTPAGLKGKEPAQRVGGRRIIKPTIKAQQALLTGFFSTRTVLIDGKESVQKSSADSGPSKQVGGTQKRTKASVLAGSNKRTKTTVGRQNTESSSEDSVDDQDFVINEGGKAKDGDGGDDTEEEGGYEQMREDPDQDRRPYQ